jgi:hypothetical protein
VLFTWSILYWACKDGNRAAVMLRLCNIISLSTHLQNYSYVRSSLPGIYCV